LALTH